jgi:Spy/CpxP family protein refolding chaperone
MRFARLLAGCAGVCVAVAAMAQEAPLAGPRVDPPEAEHATLVVQDIDGRVRRPETSPEEAAARLLELDAQTRARVDTLFADRARALEEFIENNLDLMLRLVTAESAPGREKFALVVEAVNKTESLRKNGPLDAQVRGLLDDRQRREFDRLMKGYWDAIAAEDRRQPKPKGRVGAIIDERFKSLGREVEAAYKRCERTGGVLYHYLFDSIDVTAEQEKQLRALCANYAMNGVDNNDKKAQGVMFASLVQVLTPEQGAELAKKFKGGAGYQKKKAPRSK